MKLKILQLKTVMLFFATVILSVNVLLAQELTSQAALALVKKNATNIGLSKNDLLNLRISAAYVDETSGATLVYAQQTYKGVDIFNSIQTYAFKNGKLVSAAGGRAEKLEDAVNVRNAKATITPANAVSIAAGHLKLAAPAALTALKAINDKEFDFGQLNISSVNIKSKLIWLADEIAKNASLAWQVEIWPREASDYWLVNVDAVKGIVISKMNLTVNCAWEAPVDRESWRHVKGEYNTTSEHQFAWNVEDDPAGIEAVTSAKYKVIPFPAQSPYHPGGTQVVRNNPWTLAGSGNAATTLKWNDDGTNSYDSTRGNNVLAQEDVNGNNGFGKGAKSTQPLPNLVFNATFNYNTNPTAANNQRFAITNLFYWNNIIHDIAYQYGFNEVSGNFQKNNLGRGGAGNDFVLADAQDGSGTNNANFATPADGSSPRMQMFLWSPAVVFNVLTPASFAGIKSATESGFSTNNKLKSAGIQKALALYADNAGNTSHLACAAATNPGQLKGKIALIDRGNCDFITKVKNAQNAGAVAAIVVDNVPGEYPIIMGGTDNTITIPAVMVSYETGDTLKQLLGGGTGVTVKMSVGPKIDGDLDNGVITHEYTHGISNRLTGGPNNVACLQNKEQMGEGWSDYMALMVTTDWKKATLADSSKARPIGTYVVGQQPDGSGIRYYPYSTDFNINPWTYDSMKLSSRFSNSILKYTPHVVGEVWCNMLWNLTWALCKDRGIGTNIYNAAGGKGNQVALRLVMQGMKLQACSPGFVTGRDAILKADTLLYAGANSATIWKVFASKGLGYFADQGSTKNIKDGIADYSLPPAPFAKAVQAEEATAAIASGLISLSPNPASQNVTLTIKGNKLPLKVDLINAGGQQLQSFSMRGESLNINLPKLSSGMYYIKITGENFSQTRKLIIQ